MPALDILNYFILGTIPNPLCKNHTAAIFHNFLQPWALHLLDSAAKMPAGLMTGNLVQFGNMDECLNVKASGDFGEFTGKYCTVHIPLKVKGLDMDYQSGICIPSTCSPLDLRNFLRYTLHLLTADVNSIDCSVLNEQRPYQAKEIVTILIMTLLLLLVALSTVYDYYSEKKNILLQSFSLKLTVTNLLDTSTPPAPLDFLHGVRFIAISLVVLAHVYMIKIVVRNEINETLLMDWLTDWEHTWLTSRGIVVDVFFVMGGLLTTYTFLKNRDRGKKFSLVQYWIHRYMRMAPSMAMLLLFEATLTNRLGTGPLWKTYAKGAEDSCQQNWWKHMLFINNWWGIEKCIEHTWYIAADMQFNLLAPLLLIPLHRRPRLGLTLALGTAIVSFFITFGLSLAYEENVDIMKYGKSEINRKLYRATYNRAIPWLTGFVLGYFLYKYNYMNVLSAERKTNTTINEKFYKFFIGLVLWSITFGTAFITWFAVYPFLQLDYVYNALESAAYLSTSHVLMAIASTMGFVLVWIGYGGPLGLLLTWRFFLPLSKLSYSIYLIHLLISKVALGDVKTTEYLNDFNLVLHWISILVFTVLVSPLLTLVVEYPFTIIEMALQHKYNNSDNAKPDPEAITSYGTLAARRAEGYVNSTFELSEGARNRKPDEMETL